MARASMLHQPGADVLMAEVDGEPVAAMLLFYFAGRAYYLYGMSTSAHRDKMPNHLLQWEAISDRQAPWMHRVRSVGRAG